MIKRINVAGIPLDNYTVRESILQLENDLSDYGFHTIEEVNVSLLMKAATDSLVKRALLSMEHTVIAENAILNVAQEDNYQRSHEVAHHDFFYEFMRRMEKSGKSIFLLGETKAKVEELKSFVFSLFPHCQVIGTAALDEWNYNLDAMINEINVLTPAVLLSVLPNPLQEHFLMENRNKLSVNLWYGLGSLTGLKVETAWKRKIREFFGGRKLRKFLRNTGKSVEQSEL